MAMKQGLDPVVDENSRVLILGTIPGDESLRLQRYYSHPENKFWVILAEVYAEPISADYNERLKFLRRKGLALWDVLRSAERAGSLDSAITNPEPNDFGSLFREASRLTHNRLQRRQGTDPLLQVRSEAATRPARGAAHGGASIYESDTRPICASS